MTDVWGLTAGKFDHSTEFLAVGVTFVHWEVRSRARGWLLIAIAIAIYTNVHWMRVPW